MLFSRLSTATMIDNSIADSINQHINSRAM
jgi:hypothetical protein